MLNIGETYKGSVYHVTRNSSDTVTMTDTGMVSAGDGDRYEHIPGLAEIRTEQTVLLMEYLNQAEIPTAFVSKKDACHTLNAACEMIPLECVVRRHLIGSYQQRNPDTPKGRSPQLFFEIFHKQALDLRNPNQPNLVDGNSVKKGAGIYMDPYIDHDGSHSSEWKIYDAHAPIIGDPLYTIPPVLSSQEFIECVLMVTRSFMYLEKAFSEHTDLELADFKLEVGRRVSDGKLVIADVCNLDSMRLLRNGSYAKEDQISKQKFRDGGNHQEVLDVYKQGLNAIKTFTA